MCFYRLWVSINEIKHICNIDNIAPDYWNVFMYYYILISVHWIGQVEDGFIQTLCFVVCKEMIQDFILYVQYIANRLFWNVWMMPTIYNLRRL